MDLILKPTEACNFSCTFCSSANLVDDKKARLHLETIYEFLKRFPETNTIIVNGGDPLMMPVQYYDDLCDYLDEHEYPANISMTSNLWDFYLKPDKWTPLFNRTFKNDPDRRRVNITTSFNYGDGRRIRPDRVFTETDFVAISDLCLERVGYRPHFISVIDESNLHSAIDNVRLAKHLGVDCKLNYAMASGRQGKPLPLSKIYDVYIKIWREGLAQWEWNTRQMANRLVGAPTSCPLHRTCDEGIRVLHPDGKYFSCGAFADDLEYEIDYKKEVLEGGAIQTPLQADISIDAMKAECYSCPMFQVCNGCRKHVKDIKRAGMVESHCIKMKSIAKDIEDINFNKSEQIEIYNDTYLRGLNGDQSSSIRETHLAL